MLVSFVLNLGAELVGKKWRAVLIWHLKDGPLRFSELKRLLPDISVKVLTEVLKEMEENGLIIRTQFNTIPVKVLYQIHPDAADFVDANVGFTIKVAEYMVKNNNRHGITKELIAELIGFIEINKAYKPKTYITKK